MIKNIEQRPPPHINPDYNHRPVGLSRRGEGDDLPDGYHVHQVEFGVIHIAREVSFIRIQSQVQFIDVVGPGGEFQVTLLELRTFIPKKRRNLPDRRRDNTVLGLGRNS